TFTYDCVFTERPEYEGTNIATVTWANDAGEQTASGSADFAFEVAGETDKVVEVWDDQTDPDNPVSLGEATWNVEGTATEFDYSLVHQGVEGETTEFTNTAWIEVTG